MAGKAIGRPPEYDPEEDAVLLNTSGESADYTNEVLEALGKDRRGKNAIASRRAFVASKKTAKPSGDAVSRMQKVAELERQLQLQLKALSAEKAVLRQEVARELGLAPEAADDDDEPPLGRP